MKLDQTEQSPSHRLTASALGDCSHGNGSVARIPTRKSIYAPERVIKAGERV